MKSILGSDVISGTSLTTILIDIADEVPTECLFTFAHHRLDLPFPPFGFPFFPFVARAAAPLPFIDLIALRTFKTSSPPSCFDRLCVPSNLDAIASDVLRSASADASIGSN